MRVWLVMAMSVLGVAPLRPQGPAGSRVEGLRGQIEVRTVADQSGTFIQIKPSDQRNPIALVLQYGEKAKFLPGWTGNGTLYLSQGLVAVVGQDGTRRMAKFPNLPVPGSLGRFSMESFEIVGIARYGESSPLSEAQVLNLRAFGLCSAASGAPDGRQAAAALQVEGCHGTACTSGGEGATSCSAGGGGCSVECATGYYACCSANTNNCRCCKIDPGTMARSTSGVRP